MSRRHFLLRATQAVAAAGLPAWSHSVLAAEEALSAKHVTLGCSIALTGPLGIAGMFFCMLVSASGMHAFGIPYLAPIAPSTGGFLRDGIIRLAWPSLAEKTFTVRDLPQDEKGDTP